MEPWRNICCLTKRVLNQNDPVSLKSVSVDVRIEGYIANVRSTLCYKNVEKNPIETRYDFPMDDQSTVYHFEAQIEDGIIIAECQEKKQAKETYDEAVRAGFSAVLMQENDSSSDIFSCLVGNLPPDTDAIIKFGYVTELSFKPDGTLSFLLPTLLNPRYNPAVESGGSQRPLDVSYVPVEGEQPYKFEIKATIVNPGKLVSVQSPKDELNVTFNDDMTVAQVTLSKPFIADHDLTLDVTLEELNEPHLIIEKGHETKDGILKKDVMMLNFFPELKDTDYTSKHEFIFVVDRSGSMEGNRIEGAKETLLLFLKSLPPGCYFNVVGFGSSFKLLFPDGSQEYSEETLNAACEHQQGMQADLGGTEILGPLRHIYDKAPMATHNRQILLLTDGEVRNTQAVIDLVKKNASNTRLFSFGIGAGASTSLVKGIARAGRGKAEFTKEGERLQPLVMKTLKAAMQLAVTDLRLDWEFEGGSCDLIQMPKDLPPLFAGERLIIYNVISTDKPVPSGKVQLKGMIGGSSVEFRIDLDAVKNSSSKDETLPIHRLAAKAQIKQLQDAGKDENNASIVLLSTAANVISCHTSMVGIDKNRKEKVFGDLMHRNVPMMCDQRKARRACSLPQAAPMPRGVCYARPPPISFAAVADIEYDDCYNYCSPQEQSCRSSYAHLVSSPVPRCRDADKFKLSRAKPESKDVQGQLESKSRDSLPRLNTKNFTERPVEPAKEPTYMTVVALQAFTGLWNLNAELAAVLKTTLDALKAASPIKVLDVWATVLALSYLEAKFGDKREEWEMVEKKAKQWLNLQDREGFSIADLLQKARAVVGQL